jgi:hypothetical protein
LLSVDPHSRPTASQALAFEYLKGAETMCDYDKQYLTRPPADLFDFENEKYSLEELKELIVGEVRLSAYQNQGLREKLQAQSDSKREDKEGLSAYQNRRSDSKSSSASEEYPTSSAPSHRISYNSDGKAKSSRDSDSNSRRGVRDDAKSTPAAVDEITAEEAELARIQQMDTNPTHRNSLSRSLSNNIINPAQRETIKATKSSIPSNQGSLAYRQSSTTSKTTASSAIESRMNSSRSSTGNIEESKDYLTHHQPSTSSTYGNVLSASNRGPKTPPPMKMDIIIQKGLRAKRVALEEDATDMASHIEEKEQMTDVDRSSISAVKGAAQSSSFLKGRHFGFMRSSSNANRTNQPQQLSTASGQTENHQRNDPAHAAGISSLLSQFSGRYQGLSSRSKTAVTAASSSNPDTAAERTNPSSGPLSKFVASKLVRAASAPGVQPRGPR